MNGIAATLIATAQQVRSRTLRILQQAEPQWLTWTPAGLANHMTWHAGHSLWVQGVLCIEPLSGESKLPAGWERRFGMETRPGLDHNPWPGRDELLSLLTAQLHDMEELLASADPATLEIVPRGEKTNGIGWEIIHGLHDEAIHQGEMFLLLKMCRTGHAKPA